jgi:hypothetical protein
VGTTLYAYCVLIEISVLNENTHLDAIVDAASAVMEVMLQQQSVNSHSVCKNCTNLSTISQISSEHTLA